MAANLTYESAENGGDSVASVASVNETEIVSKVGVGGETGQEGTLEVNGPQETARGKMRV